MAQDNTTNGMGLISSTSYIVKNDNLKISLGPIFRVNSLPHLYGLLVTGLAMPVNQSKKITL
ncbi:hypothetical protein [Candidatus Ishikawella capsulata]|uniref:Uncharacterized protein n=1 Tax=Candidatus Ishikawaella capsulata Mpkobe TaxID=476281 RepID=C5WCY2_9ENTR|nr:hypothetical protein [Candidatus Ishikawaella capsulata]BAH83188.1 hypothetical protein ICMP_334 [Candidatus Ishikawaella capsulata Mpkobe]